MKKLEKEARTARDMKQDLQSAKTWLKLAARRPLDFPARFSKAGNNFAPQVSSYLNSNQQFHAAKVALDMYNAYKRVAAVK